MKTALAFVPRAVVPVCRQCQIRPTKIGVCAPCRRSAIMDQRVAGVFTPNKQHPDQHRFGA